MSTQALRTSPAILIHGFASSLQSVAQVLVAAAQRIDAWLETRRRAAEARMDLHRMSDRELRDIGIDRGQIDYVAIGWPR